jgi:hypothetical protein
MTPLQTPLYNDYLLDDLPMGSPLSPTFMPSTHAGIGSTAVGGAGAFFSFDAIPVLQQQQEDTEENITNITCYILMLDLLLKQVSWISL